jgi:hypothetical protein
MQNVLEDTGGAAAIPQQHPRLVSRIFGDYRNNLGLFWRVMFPLIILNLLLCMGMFLFFKLVSSEGQWTISTASSLATTSPPAPAQSEGVKWGMHFGFSSVPLGLLWLAMCPLVFIIVQRRNGIDLTFKAVWQQTLRKTVPILGAAFLIGLFASGVPLIAGFISETLDPAYGSMLFSVFMYIAVAWFVFATYFVVKWSLCNQGIIIENLSAMAALRRSSELVRGTWQRFFRIYLLLAWTATVVTSILLGLTLVLLSFAVPEFIPMREILLPGKFISFFFFGYAEIILENTPNFSTIGAVVGVQTLVYAILAPIWAILTTHLYMERVDEHAQQVSAESDVLGLDKQVDAGTFFWW